MKLAVVEKMHSNDVYDHGYDDDDDGMTGDMTLKCPLKNLVVAVDLHNALNHEQQLVLAADLLLWTEFRKPHYHHHYPVANILEGLLHNDQDVRDSRNVVLNLTCWETISLPRNHTYSNLTHEIHGSENSLRLHLLLVVHLSDDGDDEKRYSFLPHSVNTSK